MPFAAILSAVTAAKSSADQSHKQTTAPPIPGRGGGAPQAGTLPAEGSNAVNYANLSNSIGQALSKTQGLTGALPMGAPAPAAAVAAGRAALNPKAGTQVGGTAPMKPNPSTVAPMTQPALNLQNNPQALAYMKQLQLAQAGGP